jgi:putative DNA primase/helicase
VHPDPVCEAIRWRICEGELMQAIGRARGVNRSADDPVDIDILADVCLPVTLNEFGIWQEPSTLWESAAQGVVLTNRSDMVKCFPEIWPNGSAARRALEGFSASYAFGEKSGSKFFIGLPIKDFEPVFYQPTGQGMQKRHGYFLLALVPDPRAWLEQRLGPLASFEKVEM